MRSTTPHSETPAEPAARPQCLDEARAIRTLRARYHAVYGADAVLTDELAKILRQALRRGHATPAHWLAYLREQHGRRRAPDLASLEDFLGRAAYEARRASETMDGQCAVCGGARMLGAVYGYDTGGSQPDWLVMDGPDLGWVPTPGAKHRPEDHLHVGVCAMRCPKCTRPVPGQERYFPALPHRAAVVPLATAWRLEKLLTVGRVSAYEDDAGTPVVEALPVHVAIWGARPGTTQPEEG